MSSRFLRIFLWINQKSIQNFIRERSGKRTFRAWASASYAFSESEEYFWTVFFWIIIFSFPYETHSPTFFLPFFSCVYSFGESTYQALEEVGIKQRNYRKRKRNHEKARKNALQVRDNIQQRLRNFKPLFRKFKTQAAISAFLGSGPSSSALSFDLCTVDGDCALVPYEGCCSSVLSVNKSFVSEYNTHPEWKTLGMTWIVQK